MLRLLSVIYCFVFSLQSIGQAQSELPPIEAYGDLPVISRMAISPSGEQLAFLWRKDGVNAIRVVTLPGFKSVYAAGIGDIKANGVSWAGENHVILRAFTATTIFGFRGKLNYSGAFSLNLEKGKITQLLKLTDSIYPGQSGLGRIVGQVAGKDEVYMPAWTGPVGPKPDYSLMTVNLNSGRGRTFRKGDKDGYDWFVDTDGTVLARERYNNKTNRYMIETRKNGKWETVINTKSETGPLSLVGVTPDRSALVMSVLNEAGFNELRQLNFDGSEGAVLMRRDNAEIAQVLLDDNRIVYGVIYGGLQPSYEFFDESLTLDINGVQEQAPNASVRLSSWSNGFKKLVLYIEGGGYAGDYFLLDRSNNQLSKLAASRPLIPRESVAEVLTMEYHADDGLKIPGIVTIPRGSDMKNLPAIMMPHGGPESHDEVGFDWMAQYFASRGYLVFQPNFRGSDGFGAAFTKAGYGGWGGIMQQDITDGLETLNNTGMIDPDRVCIVGGSYGGYAALAGGAFTPEIYKCIGAIAPVSDLPRMLIDEKRDHGKDHWVVSYWEEAIAQGDANRDFLKERSPAYHAEQFQAPVLLIHGRDDLVVKINQSERMKKALERADKNVKLVRMKGEDHGLSSPGARLEALQALDAFIAEHIGPHPNGG